MNGQFENILKAFDQVLEKDENFSTRSGLRLSMSVIREAVTAMSMINDRLEDIEEERKHEKIKAAERADELKWARRTMLGTAIAAMVMLFINGIVFWAVNWPLIQARP